MKTGDNGMTLYELSAYGVIGAITPSTNPAETLICNSIGMLAAGNAIFFSVHPGAKNLSRELVSELNQVIAKIDWALKTSLLHFASHLLSLLKR